MPSDDRAAAEGNAAIQSLRHSRDCLLRSVSAKQKQLADLAAVITEENAAIALCRQRVAEIDAALSKLGEAPIGDMPAPYLGAALHEVGQ